ncbi:MAG: methionine adenosyltransferase [Hyphomicrobiaceae bacterium]
MEIEVRPLEGLFIEQQAVEVVERKGLGHPDTICDMLSERFCVALSRHYLERYGRILHHNVDKALLSAGSSKPAFGGGRIVKPIEIYLGGRASIDIRGERVPVRELAHEVVSTWFAQNMHMSQFFKDVGVRCLVKPGAPELVDIFMRQHGTGAMLANDTSIGVGYAPLSELERVVLVVEEQLNSHNFKSAAPETGEDIKVMGVRVRDKITLTIACAFIGTYLAGIDDYADAIVRVKQATRDVAASVTKRDVVVTVNVADNIAGGEIYLTVAGTSAEMGDDGETGRGNRVNGLITPGRPMTLEAVAGKNPITHVGKIYNAAAHSMAKRLVNEIPEVDEAVCRLVSQIGSPIDQPAIVDVQLRTNDRAPLAAIERRVISLVSEEIGRMSGIWRTFMDGTQRVA